MTVDAKISSDVGEFSAITIGADGLPVVSYLDVNANNLDVTHCSNRFCMPRVRYR